MATSESDDAVAMPQYLAIPRIMCNALTDLQEISAIEMVLFLVQEAPAV
jgi:hypothetical protein